MICRIRALTFVLATLAGSPLLADAPQDVRQAEQSRVAAMDKVRPSVIAVFDAEGGGGGSGVIISEDGFALSNFHVTQPSGSWMKCGLPDGTYQDAVIVGLDPTGDVALIKLLGAKQYSPAKLGDSDATRVGDWVFAMGNPFLLATDFQPTVTYGIISGTHRYQYPAGTILEYADCLQTDASINPGNSGGPLFNSAGELIGINGRGSFEKRGRVNVGVAYAISINQIKNFIGGLRGGRLVDHASLGAVVSSDPEGRVIVTDILEDSDAYRRGLRYADEIVSFAGRPIRTVNAFKNALGIFPEGWRVPIEYRRQGKTRQTFVRLAGVHSPTELQQVIAGDAPNPDEPKDEKPEGPKLPEGQPTPHRMAEAKAKPKMPEFVSAIYEARPGYANYYFNAENQKRVLAALAAQGDFSMLTGAWSLKGELLTLGDAEFELDGAQVKTLLPGGPLRLAITPDLSDARDPIDSGGLLAALHFWRQLLVEGAAGFDELYYYGQAPAAGFELTDVLVGLSAGVETRYYFDPESGRLVALEMFPVADEDPCEVYFRAYEEVGGRAIPVEIEVRFGDETYGVFHFPDVKLGER